MQQLSKSLLVKLKKGNQEAFNELYNTFRVPAIRFCNSIVKDAEEAESIVQDVFIKIWNRHDTINPDLNFTSYLFTIIKNRVFDYLKEVKRSEAMKQAYWQKIEEYKSQDSELKEERFAKIKHAVENLSSRRKEIIRLNYDEGKSYEEIARQLNISKNTVKNQLVKAKQMIRSQLKQASML